MKKETLKEAKKRAKNYMSLKGALDSQYVDFSNPNADKITSASTTTIKEESKQIKCYCGHTTYCDCSPLEEPKQETLEEAGVAYAKTVKENHTSHMLGFHNGAKWQAERSYSEEEVKQIAKFGFNAGIRVELKAVDLDFTFEKWFEQFKKK